MGEYMNMPRINRYTLLNGIMKRYQHISDETSSGVRVQFPLRQQIKTFKKIKTWKVCQYMVLEKQYLQYIENSSHIS